MQDAVFAEQIALMKGGLQSLDPRVKLLLAFVLLLTVNSIHSLPLLWGGYGVLAVVAVCSAISLQTLIKRVWLVVPLFTGIMVLPALFNWVRPGDPILTLWNFGSPIHAGFFNFPSTLAITKQGFWGDVLMVSRVGVSVTIAAMLTLSTRWRDLLRAMRAFFVPAMFVAVMEMTYRYLFVLMRILEEMFTARKSRDAHASSGKEQRRFVGLSIAALFARSHQMSEEIYAGMIARGYTGEIKTAETFQAKMMDFFIAGVVVLFCLTVYAADKVISFLY